MAIVMHYSFRTGLAAGSMDIEGSSVRGRTKSPSAKMSDWHSARSSQRDFELSLVPLSTVVLLIAYHDSVVPVTFPSIVKLVQGCLA
jgi:hypothetical protein